MFYQKTARVFDFCRIKSVQRKYFNEERLNELVESIKSRGVINPILLQETEKEKYKIIKVAINLYNKLKRKKLNKKT